ncbi:MAG: hypothetical protein JWO09_2137 [Bacteroidetes bacterium]|nr:hypothetical protein [Bacteroidota bacterium]
MLAQSIPRFILSEAEGRGVRGVFTSLIGIVAIMERSRVVARDDDPL